jgi:oxalate decarboxylase
MSRQCPLFAIRGWGENFKISKGMVGVHMYLDPGASRELHWHATAANWAYIIDSECQTMVIDMTGQHEINNSCPRDI